VVRLRLALHSAPSFAAPEREVITTVGDGSYMFGNPLPYITLAAGACHPCTIITNNLMWGAVGSRRLTSYLTQGLQGQRHAAHRAQAVTRLRESRETLRRLWEEVETAPM